MLKALWEHNTGHAQEGNQYTFKQLQMYEKYAEVETHFAHVQHACNNCFCVPVRLNYGIFLSCAAPLFLNCNPQLRSKPLSDVRNGINNTNDWEQHA
jgi:hypothetical protein